MNRTIALPYLACELAERNHISTNMAEIFIRAIVEIVSDTLADGEQVKIKGFGIFSCTSDGEIAFTPDASLAESVNAPFSAFESVTLAPEVNFEDELPEENPQEIAEVRPVPEEIHQEDSEDPADESESNDASETPELTEPAEAPETSEAPEQTEATETSVPTVSAEHAEESSSSEPVVYYEEEYSGFSRGTLVTGILIGLILGFVAGYFMQDKIDDWIAGKPDIETVTDSIPEEKVAADTIAATSIVEAPAPVEVFDTIRTNRFLTTMAREHFGCMEYWVYIYIENRDIISNPNRARPGTVVRIPDIRKYVTSTADSVNIARAKAKAEEIYAPYR